MKRTVFKRIWISIIAVCMVSVQPILSVVPVHATEQTEGKIVRVACDMNDALYMNSAGEIAGICLPYLQQLAWNNNWTLTYVQGSYNESIQNLYDGKVDLMFPVGKEEDPEGKLAFSEFIGGYQQIGLFAKDGSDIYYEDYEGFNGKKVGLSLGGNSDILDSFAAEHDFSYETVALNSTQDKIQALNDGSVDLIAFSTLNRVEGGKLVAVLDQLPFYFCTRAGNDEMLAEINSSMSKSMVITPDVVSQMYESVLKGYNNASFTKEENEKIKSADKIVFGVYKDCLPLAGIDSNGNCTGIYVDLLKEIAAITGLNIEIRPVDDSNRLYGSMDDGKADFVIGIKDIRYSEDNADNHLMSNGITEYTTVAVTMPEYQFDNADVKFALTKSRTYLENYIYTNYPEAKITYYDTRRNCLDAVQSGKADATFLNTWEYNYESKNSRYQDMLEWESIRIVSQIALGATRQSDMELLSILEKAVSQLSSEKMADIIAANLNRPYETYTWKDKVYEVKTQIIVLTIIVVVVAVAAAMYLSVKRKYIKDLIVANKTKSDFLSRMSHELRTPLNAITGYAAITTQNAERGTVDKDALIENMDSIQRASDYLLGIIKDILDVQRMEQGKIVLEKDYVDPAVFMHTVVSMFRPLANEKNIDFTYNMINGAQYNYLVDGVRMQQILFNLLYNAVKFTAAGGKVTMSSDIIKLDDTYIKVRFVISDTGIGMSKEFMENNLFHKFAQENQDITSPYEGCGNGLAICKELVELMDGSINCESEQGVGTTFTVDVKAQYTERMKEKNRNSEEENHPKKENGAVQSRRRRREHREIPSYELSGICVLLCEDNPMNQDMTRKLLERMHCKVEIADNGKIGLEKFKESAIGTYNIVLMDIRMPEMDGLEAARCMRAADREDAPTIPIVALSANAFAEDVKKSLEAGMNEHIAKPASAKILYEKIAFYCKKDQGETI